MDSIDKVYVGEQLAKVMHYLHAEMLDAARDAYKRAGDGLDRIEKKDKHHAPVKQVAHEPAHSHRKSV